MPATGARKIYIIDEVHMLTTAAFNALLKTLEEPPAHVVFVFATTEPHKIPATILSRCQRFDFRRVTMSQIQARLAEVAQAEKIQAEPAALTLIARAAEGGMRDAMSLLDQVISFSGSKITAQAVRDSVGLIESQTLLEITAAIFARKPLDAISRIDQAYQRGHDLRVLTRSLIEFMHGAVLAKIGAPRSGNLELSDEEWKELSAAAQARSLEEIELIFQVLHHGLEWIARSPQPKVVLDVLVVKCATAEALVYAGASPDAGTPGATGGGGAGLAKPAAPAAQTGSKPGAVRQTAASVAASAVAPSCSAPAAEPPRAVMNAHAIAEALERRVSASAAAQAPQGSQDPKTWEGFIAHVRQTRPLLASILEHGSCESPDLAQELSISYPSKDAYYREQLQSRIYSEQLLNLSKEYFGGQPRINIELKDGGESVAARREREQKEREQNAKAAAKNHPMILEAKALFGGELGPIELNDNGDVAEGPEAHVHP
jgi:DNA polymerase-3 subunit gamma/tau